MYKQLFLIFFIFFLSCKSKNEKINPSEAAISESIYASGVLKSENQYQVFAPVSGIINQIFVSEGDTIKKNGSILSIANETQQLSKDNALLAAKFSDVDANRGKLNEAQLFVEFSKNKMKNDSSLYVRQTALWKQNVGTKVELEQRELVFQSSKNTYYSAIVKYKDLKRQLDFSSAQAKNNLQISNKLANDFIVKSKIDGTVYAIPLKIGEIVSPQTPIATIGDAKKFILEMQVDEYDILKIQKGLTVLVTMDSYKGQVFEALVTRLNPLMNERSKTFLVEAEFLKPPKMLYPNTSFEANIVIQSKKKALLIPRNYLFKDNSVIKSNGDTVKVIIGLKDYQKVEIISGISAADEIVKPLE
jgi:HlyD family secretion protein